MFGGEIPRLPAGRLYDRSDVPDSISWTPSKIRKHHAADTPRTGTGCPPTRNPGPCVHHFGRQQRDRHQHVCLRKLKQYLGIHAEDRYLYDWTEPGTFAIDQEVLERLHSDVRGVHDRFLALVNYSATCCKVALILYFPNRARSSSMTLSSSFLNKGLGCLSC